MLGYCFTPYQRVRLYNGAPFSRLLRHAGDTEDVFSAYTPGVLMGFSYICDGTDVQADWRRRFLNRTITFTLDVQIHDAKLSRMYNHVPTGKTHKYGSFYVTDKLKFLKHKQKRELDIIDSMDGHSISSTSKEKTVSPLRLKKKSSSGRRRHQRDVQKSVINFRRA